MAEPCATGIAIIACGALAKELQALRRLNNWQHIHLSCLDAELHNHPEKIADKLRSRIDQLRPQYAQLFVGYADCGSGGAIDALCEEYGLARLPGAHCYAFFAGEAQFSAMAEAEPGTFYLTDFLARHFERLIIRGYRLDKHPELKEMLFANYTKLTYLAQTEDIDVLDKAQSAAAYLGLPFSSHYTGYSGLESALKNKLIAKVG